MTRSEKYRNQFSQFRGDSLLLCLATAVLSHLGLLLLGLIFWRPSQPPQAKEKAKPAIPVEFVYIKPSATPTPAVIVPANTQRRANVDSTAGGTKQLNRPVKVGAAGVPKASVILQATPPHHKFMAVKPLPPLPQLKPSALKASLPRPNQPTPTSIPTTALKVTKTGLVKQPTAKAKPSAESKSFPIKPNKSNSSVAIAKPSPATPSKGKSPTPATNASPAKPNKGKSPVPATNASPAKPNKGKSPIAATNPSPPKPRKTNTPTRSSRLPTIPPTVRSPQPQASPAFNGQGLDGIPNPNRTASGPGVADAVSDQIRADYIATVWRKVSSFWQLYSQELSPDTTRHAIVKLVITADGQLSDCEVIESSQWAPADQVAVRAIQSAAPFEPLPPELPGKMLEIKMKFEYNVSGTQLDSPAQ